MEKKYGLKSNIDVINNIVNLLLTKSKTFKIMNLFSEVIKTIQTNIQATNPLAYNSRS